jgi:hypothetical protein
MGPGSAAARPGIQPDQLPRRVDGRKNRAPRPRDDRPQRPVGSKEPWRERVLTPLGLWFPSNAAGEGTKRRSRSGELWSQRLKLTFTVLVCFLPVLGVKAY